MKYGLIAEKVGHSFSADIHKKLFGYDYELKALSMEDLDSFMKTKEFSAINVTIPYKETVMPYLDYVNETASAIGAVNTIVNRENKLYGYNTDADGLKALLAKNDISLKDKTVLVLGSGGTSKTAVYVAKELGCSEVLRCSRNGKDGCITYETAAFDYADAEIIINTTPCGMYPEIGESPINIDSFSKLSAVVDVIYNPLRSKLVCDALDKGIKAVGGLYMLVAQAAYAAERFVGKTVAPLKIEEIYHELYTSKQNIVLIGMPGCGKSASGRHIAEKMSRELLDTDELITQKVGRTPDEIIRTDGEKAFRDIETEVIKEISSRQGVVISTGGGAVLRKENVALLRENGRIYFIDRPLDEIGVYSDRPLSSDRASLEKRYKERYEIYLSSCDTRIIPIGGAEWNAKVIMEEFLNETDCD